MFFCKDLDIVSGIVPGVHYFLMRGSMFNITADHTF